MSTETVSAFDLPEITNEYLAKVQERADKATDGFWGTYRDLNGTYYVESQPRTVIGEGQFTNGYVAELTENKDLDTGNAYNNASFMAYARTDVPALLKGLREARKNLTDTELARDFYHRSSTHLAGKRDLAEEVLAQWESGCLEPAKALWMIRAALAVGDVKTIQELGSETSEDPRLERTCSAALMPLDSRPVEPCVIQGKHGVHETETGRKWTDADASLEGIA
ncbi:hypothetical protein ACFQ0X_43930 [Streptomyces rectiviolaceus]|uniref:Uncharacterized protein n=1 Tax=Streptomyces rectiviolaceus TaxID=332591 RepID=A0ABP6NNF8_9ACTN